MTKPTFADHAELWAKSQGIRVAERETPEWLDMYERWVNWAFADFRETVSSEKEESVFVAQVFFSSGQVRKFFVKAETWQAAQESVQWQYPGLTVSVHSLDVYREATRERGE